MKHIFRDLIEAKNEARLLIDGKTVFYQRVFKYKDGGKGVALFYRNDTQGEIHPVLSYTMHSWGLTSNWEGWVCTSITLDDATKAETEWKAIINKEDNEKC